MEMLEPFLQSSAAVTGWLLTYTLHSSVLIGGCWLVTRFVDQQPATRAFLWKVAIVGGIGTSALVSLAPRSSDGVVLRRIEARLSLVDDIPDASKAGKGIWVDRVDATPMSFRARLVDPSPECRQAMRSGPAGGVDWMAEVDHVCGPVAGIDWFNVIIAFWLFGGVLGLGVLLRHHRALGEFVVSLREASPRSRALLDQLGASLIRLRGSDLLGVPCVVPGKTIVLPRRCEEDLSDAELRAVLAHELAHVVRRDVAWSNVLRAVAAVFWFQPLNRLALFKLVEAAELTCDDWAVLRTGEPLGLASSISRVAEWAIPPFAVPATVSMAGQGGRGLARRVRRILFTPRGRPEAPWLRAVVALLLVVPLLWLPPVPTPSSASIAIIVEDQEVFFTAPAGDVGQHIIIRQLRSR